MQAALNKVKYKNSPKKLTKYLRPLAANTRGSLCWYFAYSTTDLVSDWGVLASSKTAVNAPEYTSTALLNCLVL